MDAIIVALLLIPGQYILFTIVNKIRRFKPHYTTKKITK